MKEKFKEMKTREIPEGWRKYKRMRK